MGCCFLSLHTVGDFLPVMFDGGLCVVLKNWIHLGALCPRIFWRRDVLTVSRVLWYLIWSFSVLWLGMSCCFVVSSRGCRCLMWVVLVRFPYGGYWWLTGVPLSVSRRSCPGYKDDMVRLIFWRIQLTWFWCWDVPLSYLHFLLVGCRRYRCVCMLSRTGCRITVRWYGCRASTGGGGWFPWVCSLLSCNIIMVRGITFRVSSRVMVLVDGVE